MDQDFGNFGLVAAIVVIIIIIGLSLLVFSRHTGGINQTAADIPETGAIDVRGKNARVYYVVRDDSIEYSVDATVEAASSEHQRLIFVIRFRDDFEVAAPCVTTGGTAVIPCELPGDSGYHDFHTTAVFKGSYPGIPPIVDLSRWASTFDFIGAKNAEGGILDVGNSKGSLSFHSGQEFIVGNYSVRITESDIPVIIDKLYKVTVRCRDDSRTVNMDTENVTSLYMCEGEVKIDISKKTKIRIDTKGGRQWSGKGEKVEVFAWRYFDDFDCGDYDGPFQPFDSNSAVTDEECLSSLVASRILWAPLGEGYQAVPPLKLLTS